MDLATWCVCVSVGLCDFISVWCVVVRLLCVGVRFSVMWCSVGEGFNFVRDYYFGFNSSFYGSFGY